MSGDAAPITWRDQNQLHTTWADHERKQLRMMLDVKVSVGSNHRCEALFPPRIAALACGSPRATNFPQNRDDMVFVFHNLDAAPTSQTLFRQHVSFWNQQPGAESRDRGRRSRPLCFRANRAILIEETFVDRQVAVETIYSQWIS
jgi:hypothetical protein